MNISLLVVLLVVVAINLYILRKVARIDVRSWRFEDSFKSLLLNEYRQAEALLSMNGILRLNYPLPPTRGWAGSPDFLLALAQHTIRNRPKTILECSSGTSTVVLARCVQMNGEGHVFSLESDKYFAEKTRENLSIHGLSDFATVIDAPLVPFRINDQSYNWYSLDSLNVDSVDLLVIDGPPVAEVEDARYPAGPLLFDKLKSMASVFVDDADRSGEREMIRRWLEEDKDLRMEKHDCEKGMVRIYR